MNHAPCLLLAIPFWRLYHSCSSCALDNPKIIDGRVALSMVYSSGGSKGGGGRIGRGPPPPFFRPILGFFGRFLLFSGAASRTIWIPGPPPPFHRSWIRLCIVPGGGGYSPNKVYGGVPLKWVTFSQKKIPKHEVWFCRKIPKHGV